jgi:glycosyltransferase involved in cell wall biosynthesis
MSQELIKPRIFLLVPTFQPHDAVGNDVAGMYRILRAQGYDAHIVAEHIHPEYSSLATKASPDLHDFWQDPSAVLIYHHAIEWKLGEQILNCSQNKIVIKYHNVTPPEYYAGYDESCYGACVRGVEATRRLAKGKVDFVWGDSAYNSREFIDLGVPPDRCRVVAPIHRIEDLGHAPLDAVITGTYRGDTPNILFVGAFRPNKGHFKALDVYATYLRRSGRNARMIFVGSFDPLLGQYVKEIEEYSRSLEVDKDLYFHRSVTLAQLRSYYTVASVFLCVSEHEGFCVPLAEAMYFRTPIVAWATSAVGETCGPCGVVREQYNADLLAEGIQECVENPLMARALALSGRLRYETEFHPDAIGAKFMTLVREVSEL